MSAAARGLLTVATAGKENSGSDDGKRQQRKGPMRNIAAPFQPSPANTGTPKVCPLTYRDRPSNRIDYMSCHFQELDTGKDITFEKYVGPTPESNWVIAGKLLVGAYPASQDDAETFELLTSILRLGVTQFVCLQLEYKAEGVTEAMWRRGQALRPYYEDVKLLIKNKHMFKVLSQDSAVCESNQLSFVHLPIKDCSVTDDSGVFQLALTLVENLHRGEIQYLHCWGGHGRTGTVVCIMLHLMYGLSAQEAMDYCQTVHDLRQCPVAVGSPQTQSQRDQVCRIIRIAELQEKRYQESLSSRNRWGDDGSDNKHHQQGQEQGQPVKRFTFDEVDEVDDCKSGVTLDGSANMGSTSPDATRGNGTAPRSTKQRSESTDSSGSVVPSHPVKKSSGRSSDDEDTPTDSTSADQQPQKYQAVEPARVKSGNKSTTEAGASGHVSCDSSTDFPAIASTVWPNDPPDADDRVTPVLQGISGTSVLPNPHLEPTDKSGNEKNSKREKATALSPCSDGKKTGNKEATTPPSPSSWFWSSTSTATTKSTQSQAHPKPPKDNSHSSSSSWKGSLKGLRKWSSPKFKSPPSTPTALPSDCSESDANQIHNAVIADCDDAGSDELRKVEDLTTTATGEGEECSIGRQKSNGRKWSLPNPLKSASSNGSTKAIGSPPTSVIAAIP